MQIDDILKHVKDLIIEIGAIVVATLGIILQVVPQIKQVRKLFREQNFRMVTRLCASLMFWLCLLTVVLAIALYIKDDARDKKVSNALPNVILPPNATAAFANASNSIPQHLQHEYKLIWYNLLTG